MAPLRVASKTAFATIKSAIDTPNSSNTVLLFLIFHNIEARGLTQEVRVFWSFVILFLILNFTSEGSLCWFFGTKEMQKGVT